LRGECDSVAVAGEIVEGNVEDRQAVEKVERIASVRPFELTRGIEVPVECAVSIGRSIARSSGQHMAMLKLESDIRLPIADLASIDSGNIAVSISQSKVDKKHAVAG